MARNYGTGGPKQGLGGTGTLNGPGSSEREDLANFISMITRDETPFMSSIGKTKANAILHEWQTDELAVPGTGSIQSEGAGFNDVAGTQGVGNYRTRIGNYTQINSKTVSVSGTKRAVDQAGVADEYAYQLKKRGTELRRDVEWSLIHSNQSSAQGGAVGPQTGNLPAYPAQFTQNPARTFGGYQAFINFASTADQTSNNGGAWANAGPTLVVGASGQAPVKTGTGATTALVVTHDGTAGGVVQWTAPGSYDGSGNLNGNYAGTGTAGTVAAQATNSDSPFQLTAVDVLMQNIYQNGGKANKMMTSPANRKAFSARAQGAGVSSTSTTQNTGNVRRNIDEAGSLRQSVEIYMSDFGDIMVVPNYVMGLANGAITDNFALVYDSMWFNYASLRPLHEVDLGQLGDSIIGQIVEEGTLEVRNPKGCGLIVGLSGA